VGSVRDYEVDAEVVTESGEKERVTGRVSFSRLNRAVWVRGRLEASVGGVCSRCLTPIKQDVTSYIDEMFQIKIPQYMRPEPTGDGEEAEFGIGDDHVLDLEEVVRQAFILNTPMKSLCSQECKGICSVCGGNKNIEPCDCEARSTNPVLNRLADLLSRSGEEF
jgi:uncharacterized protein